MGVKGHRTEYGVRWLEREIGASRGVVEGRRKTLEGIIMDEWPTRTACKEWATSATSLKIDEDRVKSRLRELTQRVVSTFSDDVWLQRKEPDPRKRPQLQLAFYTGWLWYLTDSSLHTEKLDLWRKHDLSQGDILSLKSTIETELPIKMKL